MSDETSNETDSNVVLLPLPNRAVEPILDKLTGSTSPSRP